MVMRSRRDLTGMTFGRWLVEEVASPSESKYHAFHCRCDCGKAKIVGSASLLAGTSKSCGCYQAELAGSAKLTHGLYGSPTHKSWAMMIQRCTNPKTTGYKDYGGRGIKVCQRWVDSFQNFMDDMGERPKGTSIDRIDCNMDYCPENCKWSDRTTQANNTTRNRMLELNGETKSLTQWAREYSINSMTLSARLKTGLNLEDALKRPVRALSNKKQSVGSE